MHLLLVAMHLLLVMHLKNTHIPTWEKKYETHMEAEMAWVSGLSKSFCMIRPRGFQVPCGSILRAYPKKNDAEHGQGQGNVVFCSLVVLVPS